MSLSFFSSQRRPTIVGWIVIALVLLAASGLVHRLFKTDTVSYTTLSGGLGIAPSTSRSTLSYDASSGDAFYAAGNVGKSVPPTAPEPSMQRAESATEAGSQNSSGTFQENRVIKTASLTLRVKNVLETIENVRSLIAAKQGFVENSSVYDSGGPRYGTITLRVPVAVFETTISELKRFGSVVLQEDIQGQDVTMEFVDLEADIRNAKAEEASYLEILKRSGDIEDVLAVTQRLAEVRGRIERLEGRERYLEQRTDFSTITLSLTEEARIEIPGTTWKPGEVVREAISNLIEALQGLVDFLIRLTIGLIGFVLPILLLSVLAAWILWKVGKAIFRRLRS